MGQTKIKYSTQNKPEFMAELRAKVTTYFETNNISKYGDRKLVLKTVFMLLLYITPYILMITGIIDSLAGVWICWVAIGVGKAGVGMSVMHDANHFSYSKNQKVNKWMSKSMYLLGGFPTNWQYQHNTMHHGFPNIEGFDEDIDPGPYLRFSPHKPLYRFHKFQHIYAWFMYGLMTLSWVISKDVGQLNGYRKSGVPLSGKNTYTKLFVYLAISKMIYTTAFIVIPILVLPFAWYWIIVFFISMHFVTGFILTVVFQTAHVVTTVDYPLPDSEGNMENTWAVHQLHTTSDFAPKNKVLSWFIGGLNYQVEHHLFPNISHVHYPAISKLVREMAEKYGFPYHVQPGFLRAVAEHGRMLKKLGRIQQG
jgi:linoleoyl-CoA desaturase